MLETGQTPPAFDSDRLGRLGGARQTAQRTCLAQALAAMSLSPASMAWSIASAAGPWWLTYAGTPCALAGSDRRAGRTAAYSRPTNQPLAEPPSSRPQAVDERSRRSVGIDAQTPACALTKGCRGR